LSLFLKLWIAFDTAEIRNSAMKMLKIPPNPTGKKNEGMMPYPYPPTKGGAIPGEA